MKKSVSYSGSNKAGSLWFWLLVFVSVLIGADTFALFFIPANWNAPLPILKTFDLTVESNSAAWWSGSLLMIAGMHALDGYFGNRNSHRAIARAWLSIAIVVILLSLDEIGSLHERVGVYGVYSGFGVWVSLIPFAAVMLGLLAYAFSIFFTHRRYFWDAVKMLIAFLLFGMVALQEFIEHQYVWEGVIKAVRAVLEEGTELAGMLLLVRVTMRNTGCFKGGFLAYKFPTFEGPAKLQTPAAAAAVIVTLPLAVLTAHLQDGRGHPADWLAAALALATAALFIRTALGEFRRDAAVLSVAGALLFVTLSWAVVAIRPYTEIWLPVVHAVDVRALVVMFLAAIYLVLWGRKNVTNLQTQLLFAGLLLCLLATVKTAQPIAVFGSACVFATLALYWGDALLPTEYGDRRQMHAGGPSRAVPPAAAP